MPSLLLLLAAAAAAAAEKETPEGKGFNPSAEAEAETAETAAVLGHHLLDWTHYNAHRADLAIRATPSLQQGFASQTAVPSASLSSLTLNLHTAASEEPDIRPVSLCPPPVPWSHHMPTHMRPLILASSLCRSKSKTLASPYHTLDRPQMSIIVLLLTAQLSIRNNDSFSTYLSLSTSSRTPLLTFWSASWCSTCKAVSPLIYDLVESGVGEEEGGVSLATVEFDSADIMSGSPNLPLTYMITSIPTLLSFDGGEAQAATKLADARKLSDREFLKEWIRTEARRHGDRGGGGGGGGASSVFGGLFGR
ncbi:hypothetical protein FZEAL_498 [Fusarium zealandicum]|uniref:Thioredoxin domain-containing protein n=1 Tax=Fusarium zealandicum TaxID=1053134 RepID=A0A8H4XQU4_9HYPO|nr:hypothetical protein FZEAL_498 [Fusarium zealandicum]